MKYRKCEYCGATLDFGERCECREAEAWAEEVIKMERDMAIARGSYIKTIQAERG